MSLPFLPNLSRAQIADIKETFKQFDKNHDGVVSLVELRAIMDTMGLQPSHAELQQMMKLADTNGNGKIEFGEFLIMMSSVLVQQEKDSCDTKNQELEDAFGHFDLDGSGKISPREIKLGMAKLGDRMTDEQIQLTMDTYDLNQDGMIDFDEFKKMMTGEVKPASLHRKHVKMHARPEWRP